MIKKGQIHEIEITGMTHDGMGVGKIDGFAVFVQGAIDEETVQVKIIKALKNYAIGRIIDFIKKNQFNRVLLNKKDELEFIFNNLKKTERNNLQFNTLSSIVESQKKYL